MMSDDKVLSRFQGAAVGVAYRTETGLRDRLARRAASRGWIPAVIPYSGYGSANHARVLGRVVLAPAAVDPAARRGIPAWRRLLTLESPGTEVEVEIGGSRTTATSDAAGIIDAEVTLESTLPPGLSKANLTVAGREPVPANVHVLAPEPVIGVICDIDDTVWVTGISHPLRAGWRTARGTSSTRRSVPGMARLLRRAVEDQSHPRVVYLSNGPWNLVGPVSRFLERNDFPAGALLMTDWGITPDRWFRDGRAHKSSALKRLAEDMPHVRWVLVGDDGEHDPVLYADFARTRPDQVVAIALRQVRPGAGAGKHSEEDFVGEVPIVRGADGDALLPILDAALNARRG